MNKGKIALLDLLNAWNEINKSKASEKLKVLLNRVLKLHDEASAYIQNKANFDPSDRDKYKEWIAYKKVYKCSLSAISEAKDRLKGNWYFYPNEIHLLSHHYYD